MIPVYNNFAKKYSDSMGEEGDDTHRTQIDPYVYKTIGEVNDKTVCDLGCGNGYMARHFSKGGGKVYASDISEELIRIAKEKSQGFDIKYLVHSADQLAEYTDGFFDVVVMNMSIHYIKNLDRLFKEISRVLKNRGIFVFSGFHFFRPPHPYSAWELGKIGNEEKLFIKVNNYLKLKEVKIISSWDKKTLMTIYHRTLGDLVNGMFKNGLYAFEIKEPPPVNSGQGFSEKLQKSHNIPTFIIIGARKII
jgi:ubiquinone/menaquinone biosynthesis C-methylase UbiE